MCLPWSGPPLIGWTRSCSGAQSASIVDPPLSCNDIYATYLLTACSSCAEGTSGHILQSTEVRPAKSQDGVLWTATISPGY